VLARKIGIDLGSSAVRVYVRGEGVIVNEPALVAVERRGGRIVAVGRQAGEMRNRSLDDIEVLRPIQDGAIADLAVTQRLLRYLIEQVDRRRRLFKPAVMLCVPAAVTSGERRALTGAATAAGARQAWVIDKPLAAALGAELPISKPRGHAVCDIGAATTEVAVISRSGMVLADSIPLAGDSIDAAIAVYLRDRRRLLIAPEAAEHVKREIGSALPLPIATAMKVRGCEAGSGRALEGALSSDEITAAIREPLAAIAAGVKRVLEQAPAALAADVVRSGLLLTGGGALLHGIDAYLARCTGVPVVVAVDPQICVARGTAIALDRFEVLKRNQLYIR
jgi:rod shape-determining protein MreB